MFLTDETGLPHASRSLTQLFILPGGRWAASASVSQLAHHKKNRWLNWEELVAMDSLIRAKPEIIVRI